MKMWKNMTTTRFQGTNATQKIKSKKRLPSFGQILSKELLNLFTILYARNRRRSYEDRSFSKSANNCS